MMKILLTLMSLLFLIYFSLKFKLLIHNFIMIIILIIMFNFNMKNYFSMIYYNLMIDNISLNLILLSCWIINLSIMANIKILFKNSNMKFLYTLLTLLLILILCFSSMNLLMFYIYFETSLIPMMLLILGWGIQIDRIQATMYMFFYTLTGSLPLLMSLIMIMNKMNNNMMNILIINNIFNLNNFLFFISLMLAFLIKLPMYMIHMWLPKAHVEAPISGSMILAGIMLKLGSYGIYRMNLIFNNMLIQFNYLIISLMLIGSIYSSLICLNQTDLKIIVAYSSIVHMNMMIASLMTLTSWSFHGNLWMMIAHGLCSSCMFYLVNLNYERFHTRNLFINKGMINIFPSLTLWWFLICSNNFSSPPSLNLFSEMFLINGLISWLEINLIYIFLITFFSTCYSIYIFINSQHGQNKSMNILMINIQEYMIIIFHWFPLNIMFMKLFMFN